MFFQTFAVQIDVFTFVLFEHRMKLQSHWKTLPKSYMGFLTTGTIGVLYVEGIVCIFGVIFAPSNSRMEVTDGFVLFWMES